MSEISTQQDGQPAQLLLPSFFDKPAPLLALRLLGKVLRRTITVAGVEHCLSVRIIETEAYQLSDRASHSSLGFTVKRRAMFMNPGTVYMYYARGRDSLNFSARGDGNAVLIKSGIAYLDETSPKSTISIMHQLNPGTNVPRATANLCSGQTLLCRSLDLKVARWNEETLTTPEFNIVDCGYQPREVIQCRRLGIPEGRDEMLKQRYVDLNHATQCTSNPLTKRHWTSDVDYHILRP